MKHKKDNIQPKIIRNIIDEKRMEQEIKEVFSSVWENLPSDITPQERILFLELIGRTIKSYALLTQSSKSSTYKN